MQNLLLHYYLFLGPQLCKTQSSSPWKILPPQKRPEHLFSLATESPKPAYMGHGVDNQ